jgi:two-component system response regulator NreC
MVDIRVSQVKHRVLDPIKVLIVDDHAILRDSMRALFGSYSDIKIIGEASDSEQALDKARELAPDVIVMDLSLPGMEGSEIIRRIVKHNPKTRVLVLTQYCDREHVTSSIKAGASGYIPKQASGSEVIAAIRTVHRGEYFLFPSAASTLVHDYLRHQSEDDPYDRLTSREREVMRMVVEGQTSRQIASRLSISLKTVLNYRDRIMKKLALHNRTDLIKYAIRKGLVEMD